MQKLYHENTCGLYFNIQKQSVLPHKGGKRKDSDDNLFCRHGWITVCGIPFQDVRKKLGFRSGDDQTATRN